MTTTWNKEAGKTVFPPHADPHGPCCLRDLLAAQPWRRAIEWPEGFEGGIAHRLDVPTSGALLVADSPEELEQLRDHFKARRLRKSYRFQTARTVPWSHHVVKTPIAHDKRRSGRMVVRRGANTPHRGRWYDAYTEFTHLGDGLWQAVITTGVTHQIRVHAASVGLALQGDRRYGGGPTPEGWACTFRLHHAGLQGPSGLRTDPVPLPNWARTAGPPP
ncbi:MAG: RNA pseudouridine synthase [Deltaproteobacteria bacterium]|nr:MAG: RNA pseudouridine synthase [Deltaproteobacteria bacterium]